MMMMMFHGLTRSSGRNFKPNVTIIQFGRRFSREEVPRDVQTRSVPNLISDEPPLERRDWNCPRCNFSNFSRNIRCLSCEKLHEARVREIVEDQRHLPLKKGDWICAICGFLNFAKNSKCLLCEGEPSNRHNNRVEWTCDSCDYVNPGINSACLRCSYKKPKAIRSSVAMAENDRERSKKFVADKNNNRVSFYGDRFESGKEQRRSREFYSRDHKSAFLDFPIVGGKSEVSRRPENWEKWRENTKRRNQWEEDEKTRQVKSDDACAMPEFLQSVSDDDDEILEWFGGEKDLGKP